MSVDPLTNSYPWYTPYQFAGNKPIEAVDLDGLEEFFVIERSVNVTSSSGTKYSTERKYIRTGRDVGKGSFQFKDAMDGHTVGEIHEANANSTGEINLINTALGGDKWEQHQLYTNVVIKISTDKDIKAKQPRTLIEEQNGDAVESQPLLEDLPKTPVEKKQRELVDLGIVNCTRSLRGQMCGSEELHFNSQVEELTANLIKAGPKAVLVLTWDGDGQGLFSDAVSWSEKGSNGGTLLTDAIRFHNRVADAIVAKSQGKVTRNQILFNQGNPNGTGIKASITK